MLGFSRESITEKLLECSGNIKEGYSSLPKMVFVCKTQRTLDSGPRLNKTESSKTESGCEKPPTEER